MDWVSLFSPVQGIVDTGGPVVAILLAAAVLVTTVALYKIWQFRAAGVGRHRRLLLAIETWDQGKRIQARSQLSTSESYLTPVIEAGFQAYGGETGALSARLNADVETRLGVLERGFRLLDNVAQLAPLLGLFGTVLGMISAFQALQQAGDQVDPSILAGGIWVALLTTAVGLAVAMPTSLILSWLEQRIEKERVFAEQVIRTLAAPRVDDPSAGLSNAA